MIYFDTPRLARSVFAGVAHHFTHALKESNAMEHTIEKKLQNAGEESGANGATSSVLDIFREAREAISEEEYEKLPADGLEQIDHYVYGVPQR